MLENTIDSFALGVLEELAEIVSLPIVFRYLADCQQSTSSFLSAFSLGTFPFFCYLKQPVWALGSLSLCVSSF